MKTLPKLTVYFDGGCPVCAREIAHYRRIAPDAPITWVDADQNDAALTGAGLSRASAMEQLHARDADERWHIGVAAFIAIWQRVPRYRWAAGLVSTLRLTAPLQWVYAIWAARRFRRLCRDGRCRLRHPPS